MKKVLSLIFILLFFSAVHAQTTFTSIEQAKYTHGTELEYIGKTRYNIEIHFQPKKGYIHLKNMDTGYEGQYINVLPGEQKNTWRAYSRDTKKTYLFSFITIGEETCIAIDDDIRVTFFNIYSAKSDLK